MEEPRWLVLARAELGTAEIQGPISNPKVVQYYVDAVGKKFADVVPWCAAFVGAMLIRADEDSSGSLMARSYQWYGKKIRPQPGAIAVWPRGRSWQGHVNIVEYVVGIKVVCIGGNQSDAVTRVTYPISRAVTFRWPEK